MLGIKVITRGGSELTQVRKWEMAHNEWETVFGIQIGSEVVFICVGPNGQSYQLLINPV